MARVCVAGLLLVTGLMIEDTATAATDLFEPVVANENTRRAGVESAGTLTLSLRAARGTWRPEGPTGPSVDIEAFGEMSSALMVPAPLIRVREGTAIAVSIRNDLASPLRVHGLCQREGTTCAPLDVPPTQTREARFTIARAGTYHYWATIDGSADTIPRAGGCVGGRSRRGSDGSGPRVRNHRMDQPDRGSTAADRPRRRSGGDIRRTSAALRVHPQRAVLAGDRAADVPRRRHRPVAGDQSQLTSASDALAWLLLRRRSPRQRAGRSPCGEEPAASCRHAAASVGRDDGDDVDARA